MQIRGVVRTAALQEGASAEEVEMVLHVQGVGPGQPRTLVVPFAYLVDDPSLDVDSVAGRSFAAVVEQERSARWVVKEIQLAGRVLRPEQ
jgi:hypothetical protein